MFQGQDEIHLRDYWHVIRKWRWVIIAVWVTVVLFTTLKSFRRTPVYQSTVRILIDKETPHLVPFKEPYYWDNWDPEYLQTQYKILQSHALAKRTMEKLGMMNVPKQVKQKEPEGFSGHRLSAKISEWLGIREPPPLSDAAETTIQEQQLVQGFLGMVMVNPIQESRLVDVSVISRDREQAALIANTLAETYIEQNLETHIAASRDAVRWLVEEVEQARRKVADSETTLQKYKEQHEIISVEERQNIVIQKLSDLSDALNKVKIKRVSLEAQYRKIKQYSPEQLETLPQVVNNHLIQQLKLDLSRLESELSDLQKKFRSKHPTVTALTSQIRSARNRVEAEIRRVTSSTIREYEIARVQENDLMQALEEQKQEALKLNEKAITYGILQQEVENNRWVYNALLQKMKETSVTERLKTNNIRIVDRANIPTAPIAPRRRRSIMLGMLIGLVIGTSLSFFFEYLDNSLKTPEDIKQYLGMSFLGFIPKTFVESFSPHGHQYVAETIMTIAPKSLVSEAYRSLRTNVAFSLLNETESSIESGAVLLITSAEPSEGKSCTVANLGITMAQSGRKTLILDCDFRRPAIHQIFNIQTEWGFADMLTNIKTDRKQIQLHRTDIPNLHVIPCGKIPSNPSELLGTEITEAIINALRKRYDTILLDSPPVNTVTDSVILSHLVNGVIIVIRAGKTERELVQRARDQLQNAGAIIIGGVLNNVDIHKNKYYYYYSYHYPHYYREEEIPPAESKKSGDPL